MLFRSSTGQFSVRRVEASLLNQERSYLYSELEDKNVSEINFADSDIRFSRQVNNLSTDANGVLTINSALLGVSGAEFDAFDQERYSIHYSDGSIASISDRQVIVNGSTVIFYNLAPSQSNVTAVVTAVKPSLQSKTKILRRNERIVIDRGSPGIASAFNLVPNQYYGLRVDDAEISLNIPDVSNIVGIFESNDESEPILDKINFVVGLSLESNVIVGERIYGEDSGAVATAVRVTSPTQVEIAYINRGRFNPGERVLFEESSLLANIQGVVIGTYTDLTRNYTLDQGQREQFYDYSRIVRNRGVKPPNKRIVVVCDRWLVPADDSGDCYSANSYATPFYGRYIPTLRNGSVRATDIIDFRPRVAPFTDYSSSPFAYENRQFGSAGSNPTVVVTPNETARVGYSFYLGRIDRVYLNADGKVKVSQGTPAKNPSLPSEVTGAVELARVIYPPYLYDVNDAKIVNIDNRRYTMRDIGRLEDRIENLETTTTLSLLEVETSSLQVLDNEGLDRFKSGFFADDFSTANLVDFGNSDTSVLVDTEASELRCFEDVVTVPLLPVLAQSVDLSTVDYSQNVPLVDSNTRKSGDIISLNYTEVTWITQPLASRTENINPFNVILYVGTLSLEPSSDTFIITRNLGETRISTFGDTEGTFSNTFVTNTEQAQFMRSRNYVFRCAALRPYETYYPFIDGASGVDIVPKLIEISMQAGTFIPGEVVTGTIGDEQVFAARVANSNHKTGTFNNPRRTYTTNPYDRDVVIPDAYSSSSTVLNIDLSSLEDISDDRFFGRVSPGVRLFGSTSGAQAQVVSVRLVTDGFGDLNGAFFLRDPYSNPPAAFRVRTGVRTFRLTSSSSNETPSLGSSIISFTESTFRSEGTLENTRTETITIRRPPPPPPPVIITQTIFLAPPAPAPRVDPLAQTFTVDGTGAFVNSVDLFFASKSETDNLIVQLRTTELGTPTEILVQDYAQVTVSPDDILTSSDASVATRITFPSPIYLQPDITYALVLLAPTTNDYTCWISRMGEVDVASINLPDSEEVIISKQYLNGSLFKSQNGSIWTANQFEDLKFTLYKCEFVESGTVFFNDPDITFDAQLRSNPIRTLPRKLRVPVTPNSIVWEEGEKISTVAAGVTDTIIMNSNLEATGGPISGLVIDEGGVGFTAGVYNNVRLYPLDSSGLQGTANVTIDGTGTITNIVVNVDGSGYKVGDTVGVTTADVGGSGGDAVITVSTISQTDTLFCTNCSAEFFNNTNLIVRYNGAGEPVFPSPQILVTGNSDVTDPMYQGNVFELDLPNHGMHADNNIISIKGILPDTIPTTTTQIFTITSNQVSIADRKSTRLNSSHSQQSRMPSSA